MERLRAASNDMVEDVTQTVAGNVAPQLRVSLDADQVASWPRGVLTRK